MYKIEGFYFKDEEMARQAMKEIEGIQYIRERVDMDNPDMVLKVYNQLVKEHLFSSPVGLSYLRELQSYLYRVSYINEDDIESLLVDDYLGSGKSGQRKNKFKGKTADGKQKVTQVEYYRRRYHICAFISAVLAVCIVGMFAITIMSSNNVNILNYKEKLVDQYEGWHQELKERENRLNIRESQLNERESQLNMQESGNAGAGEGGGNE